MREVARYPRLSWKIPLLCLVVEQPLFPRQRLERKLRVGVIPAQQVRMLEQMPMNQLQ
jgi:hypothetical protein